jgi:hypothetical protein
VIKKTLYHLVLCLLLFSCTESKNNEIYSRESENDEIILADSLADLPYNFTCDFIMEGDFHEGDIDVKNKSKWLGLFFDGKRFYTKETTIFTEKHFDPIIDDDSTHQTGLSVKLKEKDTSLFLISLSDFIKERKVPFYNLKKLAFAPGEQLKFKFLDLDYKIYATGKTINDEGHLIYKNYKLIIETHFNGQKRSSVLLAIDNWDSINFRDNFLFLGDIDGDGLIDVLMDRGLEYYDYNPTLLLSRKRSGNELVQPVGSFKRSCC